MSRAVSGASGLVAALADLVLPAACAGCGAVRVPLRFDTCVSCVAALEALTPYRTAPTPAPAGLPPCVTVGPYAEVLREVLLAYKERGRHRLARPLGALLAAAVAEVAAGAGGRPGVPLVVLPVPSTAAAARDRRGDHMARLAAHAVRRLREHGWDAAVVRPLRALPRPDSAVLDRTERAAVAVSSLRVRPARLRRMQRTVTAGGLLVVVDDVVTTGATLAAVSRRLAAVNLQVIGAAVLAATQLARRGPTDSPGMSHRRHEWADCSESDPRTRGDGRPSAG